MVFSINLLMMLLICWFEMTCKNRESEMRNILDPIPLFMRTKCVRSSTSTANNILHKTNRLFRYWRTIFCTWIQDSKQKRSHRNFFLENFPFFTADLTTHGFFAFFSVDKTIKCQNQMDHHRRAQDRYIASSKMLCIRKKINELRRTSDKILRRYSSF